MAKTQQPVKEIRLKLIVKEEDKRKNNMKKKI